MVHVQRITELLNSYLEQNKLGENKKELFVVEVTIKTGNSIWIFVDSNDGVTIDDCVSVSRYLENTIGDEIHDYNFNVSSAGLDLPLKVQKQYQKNIGKKVDIVLKNGNKLTAKLIGTEQDGIAIETEKKVKDEKSKKEILVTENAILKYEEIKTTKIKPDFSGI